MKLQEGTASTHVMVVYTCIHVIIHMYINIRWRHVTIMCNRELIEHFLPKKESLFDKLKPVFVGLRLQETALESESYH